MRYFFDTEFIEDGTTIDLISIGIVAEDGREYYAVSTKFNGMKLFDHPWLAENVAPHLPWKALPPDIALTWATAEKDKSTGLWKSNHGIAQEIIEFCNPEQYGEPEFWACYADYDWVVLYQLFGRMIDLPKGWPMYCRDLKQLSDMLKAPRYPEGKDEHHALADARWNQGFWKHLELYARRLEDTHLSDRIIEVFE